MSENSIIYLTGAPASGKTSIAQYLVSTYGARRYSYGEVLLARMESLGVSHEQLRSDQVRS